MSLFALYILLIGQGQAPPPATPVAKAEKTYLFRIKGNPGDKYTYETRIYMSDPTAEHTIDIEGVLTKEFVRQYEEQIDWKTVVSYRKITASGDMRGAVKTFNLINNVPMTQVTTDRGRLLKTVVGENEKDSRGGADIVFPKAEVKIGDYWDAPVEVGGEVVQIRYQLMSVTNVAGRETAYIEGTYHPDQNIVNVEKHQFYVDVAYGTTVSSKIYAVATKGQIKMSVWASTTLKESKAGEGDR